MITSTQLREKAAELRSSTPELVAVDMLKKAGFEDKDARYHVAQVSMEKAACSALIDKGFDAEEAVKLVKAAGVDVKTLENLTFESPEEAFAEILEKAASAIDELSAKIETQEEEFEQVKVAYETPAPILPDNISKLAVSGQFTNEDLEAMMSMPSETLTKVAAAMDEPWGLGKAAGVERPVTDPLLEFLLS